MWDIKLYDSTVSGEPVVRANRLDIPELIHGRTWEEMPVGFTFRTSARTITETDLVNFVTLVGVNEPLFMDHGFALAHGYSGRLVPGMMTFSYAEGLVIQSGSIHGTGLAFMHTDLDIERPVYVGDTICVVVEVIGSRATSTGGRGVVTTRNTVINQRDEIVMVYSPVRLTKGSATP
jgi:acyl dehydratase